MWLSLMCHACVVPDSVEIQSYRGSDMKYEGWLRGEKIGGGTKVRLGH